MGDEEENAKILEVLERIAHKYSIVDVRLNQHDQLLDSLSKLFNKFDLLEENVHKEQKLSQEAHQEAQKSLSSFDHKLNQFRIVINQLSVDVVAFESSLKSNDQEFKKHQMEMHDLFKNIHSQFQQLKEMVAPYSAVKELKSQEKVNRENILNQLKLQKEELEKFHHQVKVVLDRLHAQESADEILNNQICKEIEERKKNHQKALGQVSSVEQALKSKEERLKKHISKEIEKAKKEMVLSPESYESLQEDMNKKIELMALDAQNSVLKASVCDQQLKVVQRHIDAINQKIKSLELSK